MEKYVLINGGHFGAGSNKGFDPSWYAVLDGQDVPFCCKVADAGGGLVDALRVVRARVDSGKENIHYLIYRRTIDESGSGYDPNLPNYNISPEAASAQHCAYHLANLPQEVKDNRDLIIIETFNEPKKEVGWGNADDQVDYPPQSDYTGWADWLGHFAAESAEIMNSNGYRFAAFGYSSGTPDIGAWEQPGMLRYIEVCNAFPGWNYIALHEYSFKKDDIWNQVEGDGSDYVYNLIGRFTRLLGACDRMEVPYPPILITEWGWTHEDIPDKDQAMADILAVGQLYADPKHKDAVKCAAIWYYGPGYNDIQDLADELTWPLNETLLFMRYEFDEPEPEPEPSDDWQIRAWDKSVDEQIALGLRLNSEVALQQAIAADDMYIVTNEYPFEGRTWQVAEDYAGIRPRRLYYWQPDTPVQWFADPRQDQDEPDPDPDTDPLTLARIGLHMRADPFMPHTTEFEEYKVLRPGVMKFLSAHPYEAIVRTVADQTSIDNTDIIYVVRAFLSFGGRTISPEQFYNDTVNDTSRAINALLDSGVHPSRIWIELHNEPNLYQEGLGTSWEDGTTWSFWANAVLAQYRQAWPEVNYLAPGLSPGGTVPGIRLDSREFAATMAPFTALCDGIAIHGYWSSIWPMAKALEEIDNQRGLLPDKPVLITEASNNDKDAAPAASERAVQYTTFAAALAQRDILGVTYYVASASNPAFAHEAWVDEDGRSKGIAAEIARLLT